MARDQRMMVGFGLATVAIGLSVFDRFFVAIFALIFDALVVWVWWVLLKSLVARGAAPGGPAGPP